MGILYLATLIVGLGTILVQLVGAGDADGDADVDAGADVDADAHADVGADGDGGHGHGHGHGATDASVLATFLSMRFWTFLLMAFGMVGTLLHYLELASSVVTLVCAVAMGLASGFIASWVFRSLARAATSSGAAEGDTVGRVGKVLLPCRKDARGKIRIEVNGQMIDFLATTDEEELAAGEDVLVVEMRGEEAHVAQAPPSFLESDG